jgi:hypothetical protein
MALTPSILLVHAALALTWFEPGKPVGHGAPARVRPFHDRVIGFLRPRGMPRPPIRAAGVNLGLAGGAKPHSSKSRVIISSSRAMLLCYAVASVVNAGVLLAAALVLCFMRRTSLPATFSAVYVGAGTFVRPAKVSLALAMCPYVRRRTDPLSWAHFSVLFVPFFGANLVITAFAHGTAAVWLYKAVRNLGVR